MDLEPQDLLVLLKLGAYPAQRWTYASHDLEAVLNIIDGREEPATALAGERRPPA